MREKLLYILLVIFALIIMGSHRSDKIPESRDLSCCKLIILNSYFCNVPEINLPQKKLFDWINILRSVRETIIGNFNSYANDLSATHLNSYQTKVIDLKPLTRKKLRSLYRIPEKEDDHHLS
jgi:hypothetical protein